MTTHLMTPGGRALVCGEDHRLAPSTRAIAVVSCQRCVAWQRGYDEALDAFGMTYDDDPESPRSIAYDNGRTAGQLAARRTR